MNAPVITNLKSWLLAVTTASFFIPLSASAQVLRTWNTSSGAWGTASNWSSASGGAVPSGSDYAYIKNGGTATITTTVPTIDRIFVGGASLSQVSINSSGHLQVTGVNLIRIAQSANDKGAITVNSGTLTGSGGINMGVSNLIDATLTIKNAGSVNVSNVFMASSTINGATTTINIGGAEAAEGAGWLNAGKIVGGTSNGLTPHVNSVNFNHTSSRYAFTKTNVSSDAVVIDGFVKVNAKAGVTVLTGSNAYHQGTTVSNGAVLLANYTTLSGSQSSTGAGSVTVNSGGTLGGVGYIKGNTTVDGILKPGDYDYDAVSPSFSTLKFSGNLTLGNGSTTLIGINGKTRGASFSGIDVAGILALDGEFKIQLWDDFAIADGETISFHIFSGYQSISGSYDVYTLPDTWNGLDLVWNTATLGSTGYVSVNAIPEPISGVLILGGALLFVGLRSRMMASSKRG